MSEAFDPYYRWLGIPSKDQPPNHYRLLSIELFEPSLDVIEAAADRQMAHLRAFQTGKHGAESQHLLNAVAAARLCLLKPATKAVYDQQLRVSLEAQRLATAPSAEETSAAALEFLGHVELAPEGAAVRQAKRLPVLIYLGVTAAAVLMLVVLGWGLRPPGRDAAARATVEPAPLRPCYLVLDWPAQQREGATLEIDQRPRHLTESGIRVGTQRVELPLEPGRHTLRIRRPGFEPFEQALQISGENRTLTPAWIAVAQAPSSKVVVPEKETPPPAPAPRPAPAVAPFDEPTAKLHQQRWSEYLRVPAAETNSIGMKLVLIPPGEFDMGAAAEETAWATEVARKDKYGPGLIEHIQSEIPRHHVKITKPFYLATCQVTQSEYEQVTGVNPSVMCAKPMEAAALQPPLDKKQRTQRENDIQTTAPRLAGKDTSRHPVESVTWDEAVEFCRRLSALPAERAARRAYRLPSEAEWEYACRAGTTGRWCFENLPLPADAQGEELLLEYAWFPRNGWGKSHPVGQKKPNAWGLYDVHGNVWQWCSDWYSPDYYQQSPADDPTGPAAGGHRVMRGGRWGGGTSAVHLRSACREHGPPQLRSYFGGFRVAASPGEDGSADRARGSRQGTFSSREARQLPGD